MFKLSECHFAWTGPRRVQRDMFPGAKDYTASSNQDNPAKLVESSPVGKDQQMGDEDEVDGDEEEGL